MKNRVLHLVIVITLFAAAATAQGKKPKTEEPPAAIAISALLLQGNIDEAVKMAKTQDEIQSALKSIMGVVDTQVTMRMIDQAQTTLKSAEQFLDACAQAGKGKGMHREALEGRQLRLQGIQLSNQQEYAKAEAVLREALAVNEKEQDPVLEAGIHNNLGYALRYQNKLESAAAEFDTARQLAEKQKDNLRAGSYNYNLGGILLQLERLDPALAAFGRSAEQNKAAMVPSLEALATLMQGMVMRKISPTGPEALQFFSAAGEMFQKQGDDLNAGRSYYLMADHDASIKDFKGAAQYGEKALPFLTKDGNKVDLQRCYELLGDIYGRLGDVPDSERYKKLAKELATKK